MLHALDALGLLVEAVRHWRLTVSPVVLGLALWLLRLLIPHQHLFELVASYLGVAGVGAGIIWGWGFTRRRWLDGA